MNRSSMIFPTHFERATASISCTALTGLIIALHHRRRQKEKFEIIKVYERELGLYELIEPLLEKSKEGITGRFNTTNYIVAMQLAVAIVSIILLVKRVSG